MANFLMDKPLIMETIMGSLFYQNTFNDGTVYVDGFTHGLQSYVSQHKLDQVDFALYLINECQGHAAIPRKGLVELQKIKPALFYPHYLLELKEKMFKEKCKLMISDIRRGNSGHVLIKYESAQKRILARKGMKLSIQLLEVNDFSRVRKVYLFTLKKDHLDNLAFSLDESEFMMFKNCFDLNKVNEQSGNWGIEVDALIYQQKKRLVRNKMMTVFKG